MKFTGGLHYGTSYYSAINLSWPLCSLVIAPEGLTLSGLWKTFSFPRDQITALSIYSGFFTKGIRIEHGLEQYPPFIVFWTLDPNAVASELAENGFALEGPNQS